MALDWGNGIGPCFQDSDLTNEMPELFRNVCFFPAKYPIKDDFPFIINPKKFICLQMSGVDPNETNMVDIISENSEFSLVAINFITFERLFLSDMNTLYFKILKNLDDTPYAKLKKCLEPCLQKILKEHTGYLNLLERLIKEGSKKFNANFVHFFLGAAGPVILPIHKQYIDQFLKKESCALNFSYSNTSEYQEFLNGRTLIQILQSPIEWQNVTAKTARSLVHLLSEGDKKKYLSDLERFAENNEILANSSDYIPKLLHLSRQFVVEPFQIVVSGRRIIKEGVCKKHCRRKESDRKLILFNDILLYAQHKGGMLVSPQYFDLSSLKVEDNNLRNSLMILSPRKSFVLEFVDQDTTNQWKKDIIDAIQDVAQDSYIDSSKIEYAAPWIPDKFASKCMNCGSPFSTFNRKHHCRGCGKVMCNDCLKYKVVIKNISNEPVKVCKSCFNLYKNS